MSLNPFIVSMCLLGIVLGVTAWDDWRRQQVSQAFIGFAWAAAVIGWACGWWPLSMAGAIAGALIIAFVSELGDVMVMAWVGAIIGLWPVLAAESCVLIGLSIWPVRMIGTPLIPWLALASMGSCLVFHLGGL